MQIFKLGYMLDPLRAIVTPGIDMLQEHHKFEPKPNAGEVDTIFDVPLEMFLRVIMHMTLVLIFHGNIVLPRIVHFVQIEILHGIVALDG